MNKTKSIPLLAILLMGIVVAALPIAFASPHTEIDVATAFSMITSPLHQGLVILDVRNQSEYNTGYISGSILIPVWQMPQRLSELARYKNVEIIVHCRTGGRSHNASIILDANGFTKVYDMNGGLNAWNSSGYPIVTDSWSLMTDAREMKAYPDLREYVWQKNASMPPNGEYDKIGLHRIVKIGITPKAVIFLTDCPNWGTGEQHISNPSTDNWTKYENYSHAIYWANRGFDVYAIDYRSHFIPTSLNSSQVSFMADWGWDVWISDIKEAADKVKIVSGSNKFFISGECTGAVAALNYATKYWKDDLRGIILLDPNWYILGYPVVGTTGTETNTYNLTQAINTIKTSGIYTSGFSAAGFSVGNAIKTLSNYALQNPGAPAEYPLGTSLTPKINPMTNKTWANITEWFTYVIYNGVGTTLTAFPGAYSNLMGGYGNVSQFEYSVANSEFIPSRLALENAAMADWINCPYLAYDWNDHYKEINVPVLAFAGGLFSNRTGVFRFVDGINNTDFTGIMLKNYGHTDVFFGTYSARDVSEPAYQWMLSHRLLVGEGRLVIDNVRYHGDMIIFVNATTIDARIDGKSSSWDITEHRICRNIEVYDGEGLLGRIKIEINKECAVANGPRVHFQGRNV